MDRYFILILTLFFISACGSIDPEGIWQMDNKKDFYYLVLKSEKGIAIRKPDMKNWINIDQADDNKFVNQGPGEIFQFKEGNILELQNKSGETQATFKN